MPKRNEIYKCGVCANIVEVIHDGSGQLVCCGQPMKLQEENTTDAAQEKHVPVIEGNKVTIGSVEHPMQDVHYIEWIEATSEKGEIMKVYLNPGDKPEATFPFEPASAREFCNLHGLWKKE